MKLFLSAVLFVLTALQGMSQEKYWVFFTDKEGVSVDPYEFYDEKAIKRRVKHNIPLVTYSDLPVKNDYKSELASAVESIKMTSRWFNAAVVYANSRQIEVVKELDFVKKIHKFSSSGQLSKRPSTPISFSPAFTESQRKLAKSQLNLMGGYAFHENGFYGKGVRVAIFDAGFPKANESPALKHIYNRDGVISTFNFVKNKIDVYNSNEHGTMTFSNVGGMLDSVPFGMATEAEFLLAKTEKGLSDKLQEEENWLAAAEWADKNGADIINSSLGYTFHRHFQKDMDGKTAIITRAANIAASKGILVVNSAGNDGDLKDWAIIGAPADADSVLAVGGFDPWNTVHSSFGSIGPTSDGRMKPNIGAPSTTVVQSKNGITTADGTSFSSPLTAGFAACLLEAFPNKTNMELFAMIQSSGHLFPYFDYVHGYGVPQAGYFFEDHLETEPTFDIDYDTSNFSLSVYIKEKHMAKSFYTLFDPSGTSFVNQRVSDHQSGDPRNEIIPYFYYHIFDKESGKLKEYKVLSIQKRKVLELLSPERNCIYRFHYKGFTKEIEF